MTLETHYKPGRLDEDSRPGIDERDEILCAVTATEAEFQAASQAAEREFRRTTCAEFEEDARAFVARYRREVGR